MTLRTRKLAAAHADRGLVNRPYDSGRYRLVDRNSNADRRLPLNPDDVPVNRPCDPYCTKGTS